MFVFIFFLIVNKLQIAAEAFVRCEAFKNLHFLIYLIFFAGA